MHISFLFFTSSLGVFETNNLVCVGGCYSTWLYFVGDPKYKVTAGHDASIAIVLCRLSPVAYHPTPPTPPPWKFHHTSSKALTPTNNSKSFWTLNKCSNPVQVLTRALFLMDVSLQRAIHHPIWDRPRYRKTPIHTHISYDGWWWLSFQDIILLQTEERKERKTPFFLSFPSLRKGKKSCATTPKKVTASCGLRNRTI